ncbi:ISL3 family transposase [Streptomyces tendae]|uniref:ISL3 family transposase n=1 Tax=Streptomyces tendae TaxID=1932 RepID=UPI0036F5AD11
MREVLLRLEELLFLADPGIKLESMQDDGEVIRIGVRCRTTGARCPGCGSWSGQVHGSYLRFPADLPMSGRRVVLQLRVRRFRCEDVSCGRRTFVEQVAGLTRRYSQRTERMRSALAEVGLALAGRAGARLADILGARVSRNTVLRLVEALPEPQPQVPRVVGVDEYAMRKGRVYGTVLVDVETRRPVDLLPDREAGTVAAWLAEHPSIEVVCRDRAPFFAEGASIGAPTAVQVADRFHLWRNLGEAAERCVSRHRLCLRATFAELAPEKTPAPEQAESGSPWPTGHRFADRTRAKHAAVHVLLAAGHSRRSIQRQLGMTYRTVQRLADAARPEDMFQGQWQNRRTKLDDFKPYLHERWSEGCTNAWTLWEEIKTHGYTGGYGAVRAYLQPFRTSPTAPATRSPSPRTVTGWILTHPDTLPESERLKLKSVLAGCPELDGLAGHVRAFGKMPTQLQGDQLPQWIKAVRADQNDQAPDVRPCRLQPLAETSPVGILTGQSRALLESLRSLSGGVVVARPCQQDRAEVVALFFFRLIVGCERTPEAQQQVRGDEGSIVVRIFLDRGELTDAPDSLAGRKREHVHTMEQHSVRLRRRSSQLDGFEHVARAVEADHQPAGTEHVLS